MILKQTFDLIKARYGKRFDDLTISDVRLGIHLTAVRLSDESCGVAGTLIDDQIFCNKPNRDYGDFSPSRIRGQKVIDLFSTGKKSNMIECLKMAVLNAISSKILSDPPYKILEDTDPVDLLDLTLKKTISIVGAFQSYIRKIAETRNKLYVLELDENSLPEESRQYYVPAKEYDKIIPVSDIVIITGLTLVNSTIDALLSAASANAEILVTGPSSSIIPDILFEHHVTMVGGTRITDPELFFTVVSEGGAGYHLFKYCAKKICILNEQK